MIFHPMSNLPDKIFLTPLTKKGKHALPTQAMCPKALPPSSWKRQQNSCHDLSRGCISQIYNFSPTYMDIADVLNIEGQWQNMMAMTSWTLGNKCLFGQRRTRQNWLILESKISKPIWYWITLIRTVAGQLLYPSKVSLTDPQTLPQVKSTKRGFHGCCI